MATDAAARKFRHFYASLSEEEQATLHDLLAQAFVDPAGVGLDLFGSSLPPASLSDIWGPPRVVPVHPKYQDQAG